MNLFCLCRDQQSTTVDINNIVADEHTGSNFGTMIATVTTMSDKTHDHQLTITPT